MISFNKKSLSASLLLASSLNFSASLSAMTRKIFLSGKEETPVIQMTDKENAELFEQITNPEKKTYNIRQEIAAFCERQDVQERLNEDPALRHLRNIRDIKAHFSKSVVNPAAFSVALSRAMKPQGSIVKAINVQFNILSLGSELVNVKAIPLLYKEDSPLLNTCIQRLCQKAGVVGKPLIMLIDDVNKKAEAATYSLGWYHPVILIYKNYAIDQYSDQGIEGILAHEIGHIKHHHATRQKKIIKLLTKEEFFKKEFDKENEADDTAINEFDEAENSLICLQEYTDMLRRCHKQEEASFTHPTLQKRLEKALAALKEKRGF